jgi:hypothetical protein
MHECTLNKCCICGSTLRGCDHAHGTVECRVIDASEETIGDDSKLICFNAPCVSHGVAQVVIHSQVASQATGVVNVHNADMTMF